MEEIWKKIDEELLVEVPIKSLQKNGKNRTVEKKYFTAQFPIDYLSVEQRFLKPLTHLMTHHGKNIRQQILVSLNYWLKVPEEVVAILGKIIYVLHNYTLAIDDIQDRSIIRRGLPCAHLIYGNIRTIYTMPFIAWQCYKIGASLNNPVTADTYHSILAELSRGQAMDVYWRERSICPTEGEYKCMILRKSGTLFLCLIKLLEIYSKENDVDVQAITRLLTALGLFFQINDDYVNLWDEKFQQTKGFCEDITEGKFSFPVVYVINNFPEEGKIVMDILRQRTSDVKTIKYCRSILEKCGAMEYTKKAIMKYRCMMEEERKKLKPNPVFEKLLQGDFFQPAHAVII